MTSEGLAESLRRLAGESERAALARARAAAEAIIIEVLTRGACESDDDLEAIAAMIAGPIRAAVAEEREACAVEAMNPDHEGLCDGVCGPAIAAAIRRRGVSG